MGAVSFSFIWGLTEDCSPGDSRSDSSGELLQGAGFCDYVDFGEGLRAITHTSW